MSINIGNKLEILRGNVIIVPGCEPITAFTSPTLAANMDCNASVITLEKALELIPDATQEMIFNPLRRFLVLPSGPPPQHGCRSCESDIDYYKLLKDNADEIPVPNLNDQEQTVDQICEMFSFTNRCGIL